MKKHNVQRIHETRRDLHNAYAYLGRFIYDCMECRQKHFLYPDDLELEYRQILEDTLGGLERDGRLQKDLNRCCHNILKHLQADFPHFTRRRILVFSYEAAGLPASLIYRLAGLAYEGSVYTMKCLMKQEIECKASPWREDYLALLRHEQLPNWGRNAIFA